MKRSFYKKKEFTVRIYQWWRGTLYDSIDEFDSYKDALTFIKDHKFCSAKILNKKGQVIYNYTQFSDSVDKESASYA